MNMNTDKKIHWSFWVIGIFMLIWNVMGCINFLMQMNPEMMSAYRESERAIIEGRPVWATAGFALAVFGGAAGCIVLLLKKPSAFYWFLASMAGVAIAVLHSLTLEISFGMSEMIGIIAMPLLIAAFLLGYCRYVNNKGWLQ